jgi:hypothetical protein
MGSIDTTVFRTTARSSVGAFASARLVRRLASA